MKLPYSRGDDGQRRSNQIGEEREKEQCGGRHACQPHAIGDRHACRSHSIEKKRDSDFQQAANTVDSPVDNRSGLSTSRGPESDSCFLFGVVQIFFWQTLNRTQVLLIEGYVSKD